jgi:hypothetical protein
MVPAKPAVNSETGSFAELTLPSFSFETVSHAASTADVLTQYVGGTGLNTAVSSKWLITDELKQEFCVLIARADTAVAQDFDGTELKLDAVLLHAAAESEPQDSGYLDVTAPFTANGNTEPACIPNDAIKEFFRLKSSKVIGLPMPAEDSRDDESIGYNGRVGLMPRCKQPNYTLVNCLPCH